MNKELKFEIIKYRIQRADETVEEAASHLSNNFLHTAVNRITIFTKKSINQISLSCGIFRHTMHNHNRHLPNHPHRLPFTA